MFWHRPGQHRRVHMDTLARGHCQSATSLRNDALEDQEDDSTLIRHGYLSPFHNAKAKLPGGAIATFP